MNRSRYPVLFSAVVLLLGAGAVYTFANLADGRPRRGLPRAVEGSDTFAVIDPSLIRPGAGDYARFAAEDSAWRARHAAPFRLEELSAGTVWTPSAEQRMRDEVFLLLRDGRRAEAVAVLERWVGGHPDDADALDALAQLLESLERTDDALARYRQLAALRGSAGRAEYAAALLRAARYPDAVREYGALVRGDSANVEWRLGLARALAWGDRPREAARELQWLARRRPGDTVVVAMLRSARAGYEPSAAEAADWVAEAPEWLPYRLALARALVRERRPREALPHYEALLAGDTTLALLRETAGVYAAAGDSIATVRLLGYAVALAPDDTALGHQYAQALAWSGDRRGAIAQYSRLLEHGPTPELYLARGQLYVWEKDYERGTADLRASIALRPTYEAWVLLGDVLRWDTRYADARAAYAQALALRPSDPRVLAGLEELARVERLALEQLPAGQDLGWVATSRYAEDNAGYLFVAAGLRHGGFVGRHYVASIGVEQRRIAQRRAREPERYMYGYAVEGAVARHFGRVQAGVQVGAVRHALVRTIPYGGASVAAQLGPLYTTATAATGPLYTSLMTMQSLAQWANGEVRSAEPLTGQTVALSVGTTLGRTDVSATVEQLQLSDDNRRRSVGAGARHPIVGGLAVRYAGGMLAFDGRSNLYWDPRRYTSHALGLEWAHRSQKGLSLAVRAMPGIGRSDEVITGPRIPELPVAGRRVPQLSLGGDAVYRAARWEVATDGGYSRGREGGYVSLGGSLRVRVLW